MKYTCFRPLFVFALVAGLSISSPLLAHPVTEPALDFRLGVFHSLLSMDHWGLVFLGATLLHLTTSINGIKRSLLGTSLLFAGAVVGLLVPERSFALTWLVVALFAASLLFAVWHRSWRQIPLLLSLSLLWLQGFLHFAPMLLSPAHLQYGLGMTFGFCMIYLIAELAIGLFIKRGRSLNEDVIESS